MNPTVRALLKTYRNLVSPGLHFLAGPTGGCRYQPTCSVYAEEAIVRHGPIKGGWMAIRRGCSCHPFSKRPIEDPVPPVSDGLSRGARV